MTRPMKEQTFCPQCRRWYPAETAFGQWMRSHPQLESHQGICRFDCDILLHRYSFKDSGKRVQCLMFIEVKTWNATATIQQQDTLSLFSQALRNRTKNMHQDKIGRHLENQKTLPRGYSHLNKKWIDLRMFGAHLLRLEKDSPADGWIEWDNKRISVDQLVSLLRFELDPDHLRPMDLRDHRKPKSLPLFET